MARFAFVLTLALAGPAPAAPQPASQFGVAIAVDRFGYGYVSIGATTITNSLREDLRAMVDSAISLYQAKDPIEQRLGDGWDVRWTARDGTASAVVIRSVAGMNLECMPHAVTESARAVHHDMCLAMTSAGGKLVIPLAVDKPIDVAITTQHGDAIRSDAAVRIELAAADAPRSAADATRGASKVIEARSTATGFTALHVAPDEDSGRTYYHVATRTKLGKLDVACGARAATEADARAALALCGRLRRP